MCWERDLTAGLCWFSLEEPNAVQKDRDNRGRERKKQALGFYLLLHSPWAHYSVQHTCNHISHIRIDSSDLLLHAIHIFYLTYYSNQLCWPDTTYLNNTIMTTIVVSNAALTGTKTYRYSQMLAASRSHVVANETCFHFLVMEFTCLSRSNVASVQKGQQVSRPFSVCMFSMCLRAFTEVITLFTLFCLYCLCNAHCPKTWCTVLLTGYCVSDMTSTHWIGWFMCPSREMCRKFLNCLSWETHSLTWLIPPPSKGYLSKKILQKRSWEEAEAEKKFWYS